MDGHGVVLQEINKVIHNASTHHLGVKPYIRCEEHHGLGTKLALKLACSFFLLEFVFVTPREYTNIDLELCVLTIQDDEKKAKASVRARGNMDGVQGT
jgi:hypothetical protein